MLEEPIPIMSHLADRYRVLREIGRGGSGRVFEAQDLRHGRMVAIKVLEPGPDPPAENGRFLREIRIEAGLQHPHILPLLDSGSAGSLLYLVTPLVTGDSLRRRIVAEGTLRVGDALRLGAEISDALAHAHAHGVVHRDIKPENVLLADGHAVLCDFGIARMQADPTDGFRTEEGVTSGTPRYMSPEQGSGDGRTDSRSDLYSLGCVLYEMLVGQPPFTGPDSAAILRQHATATVPPLEVIRPGVPDFVERIVLRCLEKAPADRYPGAADLRRALDTAGVRWATSRDDASSATTRHALAGKPERARGWVLVVAGLAASVALALAIISPFAARTGPIRSVAVLPMENAAGDSRQDFFVDGFTEGLIGVLARLESIRVTSRHSSMEFRGMEDSVAAVASRLGVDAIVTGSIRRFRGRMLVSARLVRARPERLEWSGKFDQPAVDVIFLQTQLARSISSAMRRRLDRDEETRLGADAHPVTPSVYDAYLRGRRFMTARFDPHASRSARDQFARTVQLDSTFAPAWSGLALSHYALSSVLESPGSAVPRAREAAMHALALDSTLSEASVVLGLVQSQYDWDWSAGERSIRRALRWSPSSAYAHWALSLVLGEVGRVTEAIEEIRKARALDPLAQSLAVAEGRLLLEGGQSEEARHVLSAVLRRDPTDATALAAFAELQEVVGSMDSAAVQAERTLSLSDSPHLRGRMGRVLARAGRREGTLRILRQLESEPPDRAGVAVARALCRFELGESDRAFEDLDQAAAQRDESLCWDIKRGHAWQGIRLDPRGRELLRQMGLDEESALHPGWYAN